MEKQKKNTISCGGQRGTSAKATAYKRKWGVFVWAHQGQERKNKGGGKMEVFMVQHLFELMMTGAVVLLGAGYRAMLKEVGQQKTEREAIKSLLRSEMITMHGKYTEKAEIPIYGRENVQAMYEAYHSLGGNGTITKLYHEMMNLPTKKGGNTHEN